MKVIDYNLWIQLNCLMDLPTPESIGYKDTNTYTHIFTFGCLSVANKQTQEIHCIFFWCLQKWLHHKLRVCVSWKECTGSLKPQRAEMGQTKTWSFQGSFRPETVSPGFAADSRSAHQQTDRCSRSM